MTVKALHLEISVDEDRLVVGVWPPKDYDACSDGLDLGPPLIEKLAGRGTSRFFQGNPKNQNNSQRLWLLDVVSEIDTRVGLASLGALRDVGIVVPAQLLDSPDIELDANGAVDCDGFREELKQQLTRVGFSHPLVWHYQRGGFLFEVSAGTPNPFSADETIRAGAPALGEVSVTLSDGETIGVQLIFAATSEETASSGPLAWLGNVETFSGALTQFRGNSAWGHKRQTRH